MKPVAIPALVSLLAPVLAGLVVLAAAPSPAAACCADEGKRRPIGWSVEGELLIAASESSECEATNTIEVLSTGDVEADARFDLHSGGGRLAAGAPARRIHYDDLWQMQEEAGEDTTLFETPAPLARRFATPAPTLCASDILVIAEADESDPLDADYWSSHVRLTVSVHTARGFVEVARGMKVSRSLLEYASVYIHPAPDGRHAILRYALDFYDYVGDDLSWITLPDGSPMPRSACGGGGAMVIPSRDNLANPGESFNLLDAIRAQAELSSATDEEEMEDLRRMYDGLVHAALLDDPTNDVIRAAFARTLEQSASHIAFEVERDLPDGPLAELADIAPAPEPAPDLDPEAAPQTPAAFHLPKLPELPTPACDDAGCPLPAVPSPPPSTPAARAGCSVSPGASGAFVLLFPALVFVGGMGVSALVRRRRR